MFRVRLPTGPRKTHRKGFKVALNQNEKELLAVVRYFNSERKSVAKLVAKLLKDFDVADVQALTGFDVDEVWAWKSLAPKRTANTINKLGPTKLTKKLIEKPKDVTLELTAESSLSERVAYEMSMTIGAKFQQGDKFFSQKEAMAEFECSAGTVTEAFTLLVEKNLIEYADGNWRKGYVVK